MPQMTIEEAFNLAMRHQQAGRFREAEQLYRQILAHQPNHAKALHLLGVIAAGAGRNDIAAELIGRSVAIDPNVPEVYCDLGTALRLNAQPVDAIAAFQHAIALNPNLAEAHCNLSVALLDLGAADEAIAASRRAIAIRPSYTDAHSTLLFGLHLHPGYDAQAIASEHRNWNQRHAEPLKSQMKGHAMDRTPDRRLRIGYVSPDFCDHVVGMNLLPLFLQHDREQFDIVCYANVVRPDAITRRFQQCATVWRNIVGLSDEAAARQIVADRIDILVDLALHTHGNRLLVFARKPAPVQATFAGYPGSTGLTAIDYRLSDPYLDPFDAAQGRPLDAALFEPEPQSRRQGRPFDSAQGGPFDAAQGGPFDSAQGGPFDSAQGGPPGLDESIYSEKTIRLPHSFWCYHPPDGLDIAVNPLPALETGVVTFGCLNKFCKINDPMLILWAAVMRQVEGSRLLLIGHPGSHRRRLADLLSEQQIDPARIEFVPHQSRQAYLETYRRIDMGLDTHPYNGHTTSLDSLWMGVPVVTLVGQTAVSRAGWSQLSNLGLQELAAQNPEQFVQIAVDLAKDLPRLKELRGTLRQRMERSPLMDAGGFARGIEAAYRGMWRVWCETGGGNNSESPNARIPE